MKFEKINTKIVVAVGVAIILILTLVYIIFNTDIIVKHKKKEEDTNSNTNTNTEVVSEEAKERLKDVNSLNEAEKKYIIQQNFLKYLDELDATVLDQLKKDCEADKNCPFEIDDYLEYTKEPPTKITGCKGSISLTYEKDASKVDMDGVSCTSGSGSSNTNIEDPDDTNSNSNIQISENVKNRTKPVKNLTADEKTYVIIDNLFKTVNSSEENIKEGMKEYCLKEGDCDFDASQYGSYADNGEAGYWVNGCTGKAYIVYVPGHVTASKNSKGALEVVSNDTKKPKDNQIKLSDIKTHLNGTNPQAGDYVVKQGSGYVKTSKGTQNALRVVRDNTKPGKDEIKESAVVPYLDTSEISVGDYVTEGIFVVSYDKVVCKRG